MKPKPAKKVKILDIKKSAIKNMDERGFGAILEDITDKFSIMIEGLGTTNQKVDRIIQRFDTFEEAVKSNFQAVFEYLSRIEEDIQAFKSDLSNLKVSKAEEVEVGQMKIRIKNLEYELAEVRRIAEQRS